METSFPLLTLDNREAIVDHLVATRWLNRNEQVVAIEQAGEGNMNLVLRIQTNERSFIIKQSRPWVEKYPQIPAPEDRLLVEVAFYEAVRPFPVIAGHMPALMAVDQPNRIAQFEDLGAASDFTVIYETPDSITAHLPALCQWLSALHAGSFSDTTRSALQNQAMRALNHEHIFHFPLVEDNRFDLDAIVPGLQEEGDRLKRDYRFTDTVTELGKRYLHAGSRKRDVLLHGDYYPGSWLHTEQGVRILDPEFCFFGDAEFDVGVFMAHMLLAGCPETIVYAILDHYTPPRSFTQTMAFQYAGVEIMRRLIGVAQLPLQSSLETRADAAQRRPASCAQPLNLPLCTMTKRNTLTHKDALAIMHSILEELEKNNKGAAIAVADEHGELIAFTRTDGCPLPSIYNAMNKAFTSAREGIPSRQLGEASRQNNFPLTYFGELRYTGWGGGMPLIVDGITVGAVGVSGLPEEEDMQLVQLGVRYFEHHIGG